MECPNCNKPAKQKYKRVTVNYRGRQVRFSKLYYLCCVNFTTTEVDEINMKNLDKDFRKKNTKRTKRGWVLLSSLASKKAKKLWKEAVQAYTEEWKRYDESLKLIFDNKNR